MLTSHRSKVSDAADPHPATVPLLASTSAKGASHSSSSSASSVSWDEKQLRVRRLELDLEAYFERLRNYTSWNRKSEDPMRDIHEIYSDIQNCLDEFSSLTSEMVHLAGDVRSRVSVVNQLAQKDSDFNRQFARIKQNIKTQIDRDDLYLNVRKTINDHRSTSRNEELYLKESEHIQSSHTVTDDILSMATSARQALQDQASRFDSISSRISSTMQRFPAINQLAKKIDLKKKRSAVILGGVVATCVLFSLWYIFY
eukprot:gene10966-3038_t